jgi:hypothetical protein
MPAENLSATPTARQSIAARWIAALPPLRKFAVAEPLAAIDQFVLTVTAPTVEAVAPTRTPLRKRFHCVPS